MCRIYGIVSPSMSNAQMYSWADSMNYSMIHGGPDGSGNTLIKEHNVLIGHRRLSVLDPTPAGDQPMHEGKERIWISFNGEIYNFHEIRADLIKAGFQFRTNTDTEVIIKAYQFWGLDAFSKLNGMFAFALVDTDKGKLYLVRDGFSIKPLYYYMEDDLLIFASEIRAFNALDFEFKENVDWPLYFLVFGHLPEPYTTLQNVFSLPNGNVLKYDLKTYKSEIVQLVKRPASLPIEEITNKEEAIRLVRNSFRTAVKRHLISDVPIGVFLSGGIDSSLVALIAKQEGDLKRLNTLSLIFDVAEFNENYFQKIISKKVESNHHELLVGQRDFIDNLSEISYAFDQPSMDGINTWFVSQFTKKVGLKVVLSGVGADELLGGYPSFRKNNYLNMLSILPHALAYLYRFAPKHEYKKLEYLKINNSFNKYLIYRSLFSPSTISEILGVSEKYIYEKLEQFYNKDSIMQNYETISHYEVNNYLKNQLLKDSDYMSMIHSIEIRTPFLDKEFTYNISRISNSIKENQLYPKELLVSGFKHILPKEIYQREKKGFAMPFQKWMKDKSLIDQMINSQNEKVRELTSLFDADKMSWARFWGLYMLENFKKRSTSKIKVPDLVSR
jgi:asparagine synthase (glutamine-hydrolysing)